MNKEELERAGALRFFDFMASHGPAWWFCEAQPRKRNGERGAPVAGKFGMRFAFHHSKILSAFEQLNSRLERLGKSNIDLQTRESPSKGGSRVILIDDISSDQIDSIRGFWPGPLAILETSPENYQSLLVSPRCLSPHEHLKAARYLAIRFNGDVGAVASGQLHRFPGSPNFKTSAVRNGHPFITRLVAIWDGEEGFNSESELSEMLSSALTAVNVPSRARAQPRAPHKPGGLDNSSAAFRWTLHQLDAGTSHELILAGLTTTWLGHHDAHDWPARTLANALYIRGERATRYQTQKR